MKRSVEEMLELVDGKDKILLIACRRCTTVSETGAEAELKEMLDSLSRHGKNVTATIAPPFAEFICFFPWSKEHLKPYQQQIEDCDAILMMTCDDGFQMTEQWILDREYASVRPIYSYWREGFLC